MDDVGKLEDTQKVLDEAQAQSPEAVCMFSGGKDACALLDMAWRTWRGRLVAVFMWMVPGLAIVQQQLDAARARYPGLQILQYPHSSAVENIRNGLYRHTSHAMREAMPRWKLRDVYDLIIRDTGIPLILTGSKYADSLHKRRTMRAVRYYEVKHPLATWRLVDVLAYLQIHKIPLPDSSGRSATGIGLSAPALLWLHDKHPEDFAKLLEVFPYARACIARRRIYGIAA